MLVYFESNYFTELEGPNEKKRWYIDGYPEDDNEEGEVVATVVLTTHNDVILNWNNKFYIENESVKKLIKDIFKEIKDMVPRLTLSLKEFI